MIDCPVCGQPCKSVHGCSMHLYNKEDSEHESFSEQYDSKTKLEQAIVYESDNQTDQEVNQQDNQTETDGYDLPDFPEGESRPVEQHGDPDEQDTGEQCCSDPTIAGQAGARVTLDNGNTLILDEGQQICLNCEVIHE